MVSVKQAKILLLIYQIFSILGEIVILILSNEKDEIELFGTPSTSTNITSPNSNCSTPIMSSTTTTTTTTTTTNLYNQQQAYQDSLIVAEELNKAINLAITTNSLLPHNQILSKINQTSNKRKVIVVSLDGGGIKGIVTLTMLMELQKQMSGIDIIDNSDMVCGTSTGSIIAMGRSKPLPYSEIFEIYKNFGKAIFKTPVKNLIVGATLANSDKKTEELLKVFGATSTMGNFAQDKKVFVVASKLKNSNQQNFQQVVQQQLVNQSSPASSSPQHQQQQQPLKQQHEDFKTKIISNYNKKYSNVRIVDALDASSAAPIFFKPVEIQNHKFIDGGIGLENNPVLLAHKECQKLYNDKDTEYLFISLGTGTFGHPSSNSSSSGSSSGNKIIFQAQETFKNAVGLIKNAASSIGDSETTHQIFKQMINYKNVSYYRFNPRLSQNFSLSDTSKTSLLAMENETKAYMNSVDMIREVQNLKNEIYSIISFKKQLHQQLQQQQQQQHQQQQQQ